MRKPIRYRRETVFASEMEDYRTGMGLSLLLGILLFAVLSFGLDYFLVECRPQIVLYSMFSVGLFLTIPSLIYAIYKGIRFGLNSVETALGVATPGLFMIMLSVLFIHGTEGQLFLLPVCW